MRGPRALPESEGGVHKAEGIMFEPRTNSEKSQRFLQTFEDATYANVFKLKTFDALVKSEASFLSILGALVMTTF